MYYIASLGTVLRGNKEWVIVSQIIVMRIIMNKINMDRLTMMRIASLPHS